MIGTTRENWSEFLNWITSVRLDGFAIDIDHPSDSLIIRNKNTNMVTKISRMVIESIDPAFRRQHIMDTVTQMATRAGGTYIMPSNGGGTPGLGTYTISSGGSTNLPYNVNSPAPWNVPPPTYIEERYEQLRMEELAKKLFSIKETLMLTTIKHDLHKLYHNKRTIMEQQTWNRDRMVIAGGCFASMIIGEEVKDYDVFLLEDDHNTRIMEYMETKYRDREENDIRIGSSGYMNNDRIKKTMFFGGSKCQYILTDFETREELINSFDFKHCRVSYDLMTEKLFITRETMDLILNKELDPSRPDDLPNPWRYDKFYNRGWKERGHQDFVTI
jgi:hypothetical protein